MENFDLLPVATQKAWLAENDPDTGDMDKERLNDVDGVVDQVGDHKFHYCGMLGDFTYDDREFQLTQQVVETPGETPDDPPRRNLVNIVRYIGDETDGKNIHIPEGVRHAEFMFYGNDKMTSVPKIPDSVLDTHMMFAGCSKLTDGRVKIPAGVETTAGMFFNCGNMTDGPARIPGNVNDMSAMFSGCTSMKNTPVLEEGITAMDSAFSGCHSITKKPVLPKSAQFISNATYDCYQLDKTSSLDRQAAVNKRMARAKRERDRQAEDRSFMGHLGDVVGTIVQIGVMNYAGANMLEAMMIVHTLHQQKKLERGLTGVMGMIARTDMNHQHPFSGYMYNFMRQEHISRSEHAENQYQAVLKTYSGDSSVRNSLSSEDAFASGQIAAKRGSFKKIAASFNVYQEPNENESDKHIGSVKAGKQYASVYPCEAAFKKELNHIRAELEKDAGPGGIVSRDAIHKTNEQVVSLFRQQAAFYQGAVNGSGNDRESIAGAGILNNQVMCTGMEELQKLENDYHFLQPHYIHDIQEVVQKTSYKDYMTVTNSMSDEEKKAAKRAKDAFNGFANTAKAYSIQSGSEMTLNQKYFANRWGYQMGNAARRPVRNEGQRCEDQHTSAATQETRQKTKTSYKTIVPDVQPKFMTSEASDSYEQGVEDAAKLHTFVKAPSKLTDEGKAYYQANHDSIAKECKKYVTSSGLKYMNRSDPEYSHVEGMVANNLLDKVHKLSAYFQGAESVKYENPSVQKAHMIGVHNEEQAEFTGALSEIELCQRDYNMFSPNLLRDFLHQVNQTDFKDSKYGTQFQQFVQDELDRDNVFHQNRRERVIDVDVVEHDDQHQDNDDINFE